MSLNPATVGSARNNAKEIEKKEEQARKAKKKKWIEGQRTKPPTLTLVTDALIGGRNLELGVG